MYLRTVKVRSSSGSINEYVRLVEAYRDNGKVEQRTLADLGRKDLLVEILPKLQRFLGGDRADTAEVEDPDFLDASTWGPVLAVRTLFDQLGLWTILDAALGKAKGGQKRRQPPNLENTAKGGNPGRVDLGGCPPKCRVRR